VTPIILAFQSMSINQSISRTSRLCINQMHTQNRRFQFNKDQFSRPFTLTWLQFNVNCPKCRGKTGWISFSWANYFPSFPLWSRHRLIQSTSSIFQYPQQFDSDCDIYNCSSSVDLAPANLRQKFKGMRIEAIWGIHSIKGFLGKIEWSETGVHLMPKDDCQ